MNEEKPPLTVKELINLLQQFDENLPVYISDLDTGWDIPIVAKPDADYDNKGAVYLDNYYNSSDDKFVVIKAKGYY